jgi:DNA polymerase-3 subunit delta'
LAHGYLLTGTVPSVLEATAAGMAEKLIEAPPVQHPDVHWIQPQSKTRRYATEQIRELEGKLYLKPYQAKRKVAVLAHAERLCLGRAEPANAFLKTLEEPPAQTILILWTSHPQSMLPTLVSRCVRVDIRDDTRQEHPDYLQDFLQKWEGVAANTPELRAYKRASLLARYWAERREALVSSFEEAETEESDEEVDKAVLEGEFGLERQTTISALEEWYWQQSRAALESGLITMTERDGERSIRALEDLNESLQRNVDVSLAVEVACLRIEKCLGL